MKFNILVQNKTIDDNDGSSQVLFHIGHALEEHGHTFNFLNLIDDWPEADSFIYQSEWATQLNPRLKDRRERKISWLGHFTPTYRYPMPKLEEIQADIYFTQWRGECVEMAAKAVRSPILYVPHGFCPKCNTEGKMIDGPKAVFIGADYPERRLDWNDYAYVTRIVCPHDQAKDYYKTAIVSPTVHGDFQKGKVTEYMQVAGHMLNDRIFNVVMSGGFAIADDVPILSEFFTSDEVPQAATKEGYKETIDYFIANPERRLPYMQKSKERIVRDHSYVDRIKPLLEAL